MPENKISLIKQALPYAAEAPNVTRSETQASTGLRLIFIGRIDPLKGLHLLLKAMESIPEHAISLDIFGIANDNNYYESWKAETKSKKNIKWRGAMPQKEVVSTLAAYDALVLPSTFSEMSPLVIQEAFAAGVPVIGANVAGIAEQIKDGYNGLLFDFNNSSALNQILSNIVSNTSLLAAMRRNILPPSDFDSVVEQTLAVYNA